MKSLSLVRPLIIMVIGIPGSGKSFFARQFAETFHAPLISFDELRSEVLPQPSFTKAEDALLTRLATMQLAELLKTQRTVLIDGGSNSRAERMVYEKMAQAADYGTLVVWAQTDQPSSHFRATKRSAKRIGDSLNVSLPEQVFTSKVKQLIPPVRGEDFIVISGKHTYPTQAKVVLKKLVSPREEPIHNHVPATHRSEPDAGDVPRRRTVIVN